MSIIFEINCILLVILQNIFQYTEHSRRMIYIVMESFGIPNSSWPNGMGCAPKEAVRGGLTNTAAE
jgi:hypothetical protein